MSDKTIYTADGDILTSNRPIYKLLSNPDALRKVIAAFQVEKGHNINLCEDPETKIGPVWYIGKRCKNKSSRQLVIGKEIYTIALNCISRHRRYIINCSGYQILSKRPIYNLMGNPYAQRKVVAAFQVKTEHNINLCENPETKIGPVWYISKRFKNKSSRQLVIGTEIYTITLISM